MQRSQDFKANRDLLNSGQISKDEYTNRYNQMMAANKADSARFHAEEDRSDPRM
jgi:hypothetical protein